MNQNTKMDQNTKIDQNTKMDQNQKMENVVDVILSVPYDGIEHY